MKGGRVVYGGWRRGRRRRKALALALELARAGFIRGRCVTVPAPVLVLVLVLVSASESWSLWHEHEHAAGAWRGRVARDPVAVPCLASCRQRSASNHLELAAKSVDVERAGSMTSRREEKRRRREARADPFQSLPFPVTHRASLCCPFISEHADLIGCTGRAGNTCGAIYCGSYFDFASCFAEAVDALREGEHAHQRQYRSNYLARSLAAADKCHRRCQQRQRSGPPGTIRALASRQPRAHPLMI